MNAALRADRIAGAMYGAAIGDALGAAFEFLTAEQIETACGEAFVRHYHPALEGSLLYPRERGRPTDDTALALSVASTIAAHPEPSARDFAQGFLDDLKRGSGPFSDMFWTGGPGGATTRALSRLGRGADPAECGALEDGGNGAAMRAHPIGFLPDRDRVLEIAAVQAKTTHGHPAAVAAAQAVAVLVHDALSDEPLSLEVPRGIDNATFSRAWAGLHADLEPVDERLPSRLRGVAMSGWETVAAAHAIVWIFKDRPNDAIAAAAASGGDTDTVATIAGAIAGARHGVHALEPKLREKLAARDLVELAIASLTARFA